MPQVKKRVLIVNPVQFRRRCAIERMRLIEGRDLVSSRAAHGRDERPRTLLVVHLIE